MTALEFVVVALLPVAICAALAGLDRVERAVRRRGGRVFTIEERARRERIRAELAEWGAR